MTIVASRAPVMRNVVRGVIQLLLALTFGASSAVSVWAIVTLPSDNADRYGALLTLSWSFPAFLALLAFAGRNLQRPFLRASVAPGTEGIALRIPAVPFVLCPLQVVREETVAWADAHLNFTPGKDSRLVILEGRPGAAIPSGQFDISLFEIDKELRAVAERFGQSLPPIEAEHVFTGTSPVVLLIAGIACVGVFGVAIVALVETAPGLANFLALPVIFGVGLVVMGVSPRKRVVLDRRGLFVERGKFLDFIPRDVLAGARTDHQIFTWGVFESGHVEVGKGRKKIRIGFNRLFGLGFDVGAVMDAVSREQIS